MSNRESSCEQINKLVFCGHKKGHEVPSVKPDLEQNGIDFNMFSFGMEHGIDSKTDMFL
jgi:hypothetical protein